MCGIWVEVVYSFICCPVLHGTVAMVAIAQLVEHLIVVQKVARSSRVSHPNENPPSWRVFCFPQHIGGAARNRDEW